MLLSPRITPRARPERTQSSLSFSSRFCRARCQTPFQASGASPFFKGRIADRVSPSSLGVRDSQRDSRPSRGRRHRAPLGRSPIVPLGGDPNVTRAPSPTKSLRYTLSVLPRSPLFRWVNSAGSETHRWRAASLWGLREESPHRTCPRCHPLPAGPAARPFPSADVFLVEDGGSGERLLDPGGPCPITQENEPRQGRPHRLAPNGRSAPVQLQ